MLRTYGWRTAAFYPPAVFYVDAHEAEGLRRRRNFDFEYVKFEYIDAEQARRPGLRLLRRASSRRKSFVWIHFFEPHEPYDRARGLRVRRAGDIDRYDSEIAYTDAAVGRLIAGGAQAAARDDRHRRGRPRRGVRRARRPLPRLDPCTKSSCAIPLIVSIPGIAPHVVDGPVELIDVTPTVLNLLDIPVPARMRGTDLGPWLAPPPAPAAALAARLRRGRGQADGRRGRPRSCSAICTGASAPTTTWRPIRASSATWPRSAPIARRRCAALLDDWLDGHVRFEPLLAQGRRRHAGRPAARRRSSAGGWAISLAAPELAALHDGDAPLAERREAAQLLVGAAPAAGDAAALARAAADPDREVADWAAVGAVRAGRRRGAAAGQALVADAGTRPAAAGARGAGAGGGRRRRPGVPVLGERARALRRRAALPADHRRARQAARPARGPGPARAPAARCRTGARWSRRWARSAIPRAADALLERLRSDEYVPVRVQAALALARLGDPKLAPEIDRALHKETEPSVVAAGRQAATTLRASP